MRAILAAFLIPIALLAVSCGGEDDTSDAAEGSWLLESGVVGGKEVPLSADYPVTMAIDGSEVSGRAACNSYSGSVDVEANAFSVGAVAVTEMACEPPAMASEQAFLAALQLVDEVVVEGESLLLRGGGAELSFVSDG